MLCVDVEILGNLGCQFAGGGQHEAARHPRPRAAFAQKGDHRQGEACRFTSAGLGNAQNILALQSRRDSTGLNRGWLRIARLFNGFENLRGEFEIRKTCHVSPMQGERIGPPLLALLCIPIEGHASNKLGRHIVAPRRKCPRASRTQARYPVSGCRSNRASAVLLLGE